MFVIYVIEIWLLLSHIIFIPHTAPVCVCIITAVPTGYFFSQVAW